MCVRACFVSFVVQNIVCVPETFSGISRHVASGITIKAPTRLIASAGWGASMFNNEVRPSIPPSLPISRAGGGSRINVDTGLGILLTFLGEDGPGTGIRPRVPETVYV